MSIYPRQAPGSVTILYEDDLGPVYLVTPNMNEEQNSVPIPAPAANPAYPYEKWWQECCIENASLKAKLAQAEAIVALAVTEIIRLKGAGK